MENLLVSACLIGFECKYCGGSNVLDAPVLSALRERYRLIPVCPESAGGLSTPRDPSERLGDRVVSSKGADVTAEYEKGGNTALFLAEKYGCKKALMKAHSPSCGNDGIYDGTFTGVIVPGMGVAAEKLTKAGVSVYSEKQLEKLL